MINISSAESRIMEALWSRGPLTPDEVVAEVEPATGWARNTVRVMITRLLKKGAISSAREADGRFLYRPVLARAKYVQAESQGLLDRLFEGKLAPLVAHFVEQRQLTPEDLATLKALLADIRDDRR
jgi:predicted transcriptional regulator